MISGVGSYSSYSYASSSTQARPQGCGASGQNKAQEKLFSLLDANGDGSVAKDELSTALDTAKESDSSLEIDLDELFSQLDANSDGSIDFDETAALAPPPPPQGGPNPEEMFASIDSDGDGVLGLEELTSAIGTDSGLDVDALFGELDSDGDGSLNQDEAAALAPPPPPPGQGPDGMQFGQSEESTGSSDDQGYGRLVAALLKQYEAGAAGYGSSRVGSQLSLSA
ncbi:XopAW family type III secretion system calcium-binding effector [Pseudomonas sp. LFM046]|uniref:XopAW family type III secretion system calcium-binding effector n=1 Tax=Pseudomonas sp. LFM046 TaxID=1608357 RepID=UPI000697B33D|nr:XopAW family type III secretion system calcium-binding effector [Pseudomonas sp. LFM046]